MTDKAQSEIEREAKEIEKKTGRGTGRRMIATKADEEDLMRRCRRIQWLFRQLQVCAHDIAKAYAQRLSPNRRT
jgi:uncharacterized protein (UPF0128 family)